MSKFLCDCEARSAQECCCGYWHEEVKEWVGLTKEEFDALVPYCHNEFDLQEYRDFAKSIETKLKEKNA